MKPYGILALLLLAVVVALVVRASPGKTSSSDRWEEFSGLEILVPAGVAYTPILLPTRSRINAALRGPGDGVPILDPIEPGARLSDAGGGTLIVAPSRQRLGYGDKEEGLRAQFERESRGFLRDHPDASTMVPAGPMKIGALDGYGGDWNLVDRTATLAYVRRGRRMYQVYVEIPKPESRRRTPLDKALASLKPKE